MERVLRLRCGDAVTHGKKGRKEESKEVVLAHRSRFGRLFCSVSATLWSIGAYVVNTAQRN